MGVPEPSCAFMIRRIVDVPLYNNRTRGYINTFSNINEQCINDKLTGSPCGEKHIRNLYEAFRILFSNLEDYCRIILIFECFSTSHDHAPCFSNNPWANGYSNCTGDDVSSSIEKDYLLACVLGNIKKDSSKWEEHYLCEDFLNSFRVIRNSIPFSTMSTDADELVNRVIRILRMRFAENFARLVKQTRGLIKATNIALSESSDSACPWVNITLGPRSDSLGTALQDHAAVKYADGYGYVDEFDIVKDEWSMECPIARIWVLYKNGCLNHHCVDDRFCSNRLSSGCKAAREQVKADLSWMIWAYIQERRKYAALLCNCWFWYLDKSNLR